MIQYTESMQVISTFAYSIILIITLVLKHFLKDKDERYRKIPIYITSLIVVLLEFFKQLRNVCGYDYGTFFAMLTKEYAEFSSYALPFHFCSFFIFWALFQLIFMKNKKLSEFFDNMTFLWATFITVLIFFYPEMVYGGAVDDFYFDHNIFHSYVFHILVVFYWSIAFALRTYHFDIKKIYHAPICILLFACLVIPAAHIFKENYCSVYSSEGWDFLEPVFEKGYVVYDGLLVIIGTVISLILYVSIWFIEKQRDKIKDGRLYNYGYIAFIILMVVLLFVSKKTGYETLRPLYSVYILLLLIVSEIPPTIINHIKAYKLKYIK